ncbi:sigma-70 family RNA polymerase sigma factor [Mycobacterium hodleri]|uniref:sigma-70 family RNA polymerase sigma factor n=1 Tax=Mycolicibacterium hodleri TaxID=49897 RepID=UPI0021F3328D|nr:sigma-70 family RNA polymerase sigma factor [Mycolicibacterium hodleri]MCV7133378.1 sigma-70 family RNA polymerase sigma factor [Mycolicibacterium hodleri]
MIDATAESDTELAARFARDAVPLFDALSRRARRLTLSDADAEDLLQDTLLHAYQGFRSFERGTNLKAWLFRIQYHRWISAHRYKERRPAEVMVEHVGEHELACGVARLSAGRPSAEDDVLEALSDNAVRAALANLPEGTRVVMYYSGVAGYTYAETAALMDIPIGTVMSRVSRGRQRLRASLAHLDHGQAFAESDRQSA